MSKYVIEVVIGQTKFRVEATEEHAALRMIERMIAPHDWPNILEVAVARQGWATDARGSDEDRSVREDRNDDDDENALP